MRIFAVFCVLAILLLACYAVFVIIEEFSWRHNLSWEYRHAELRGTTPTGLTILEDSRGDIWSVEQELDGDIMIKVNLREHRIEEIWVKVPETRS